MKPSTLLLPLASLAAMIHAAPIDVESSNTAPTVAGVPTTDVAAVNADNNELVQGPNGDFVLPFAFGTIPTVGTLFVAGSFLASALALGGAWIPHFKHKDDVE